MATIRIEKIQSYLDSIINWIERGESPASECLVIEFSPSYSNEIIDEEWVNKSLYLQSNNGNVVIDFDATGQIKRIEIS